MAKSHAKTTTVKAEIWENIMPLLAAASAEIKELNKKKPDGTVGSGKIAVLNRLLSDARIVLADEPTLKYLDFLDEELLPQYSDVTLLLSQYLAAMTSFRSNYYGYNGNEHVWFV